jgi:hypothetical protein
MTASINSPTPTPFTQADAPVAIDNKKFKCLNATNSYLSSITSSDCTISSVAAKVSLVVFPLVILLTLLADLIAAAFDCLFSAKHVDKEANPNSDGFIKVVSKKRKAESQDSEPTLKPIPMPEQNHTRIKTSNPFSALNDLDE